MDLERAGVNDIVQDLASAAMASAVEVKAVAVEYVPPFPLPATFIGSTPPFMLLADSHSLSPAYLCGADMQKSW